MREVSAVQRSEQRSMKKMSAKLFAAVMSLIISIVIGVSVTYAWMTLSTSPTVGGAAISIGGNPSIMLAPDLTKTVDGETVHYPGAFGETLTFTGEEYAYLTNLSGLTPVSTADGVNWFSPKYDGVTGELQGYSLFDVDTTLSKANVTGSGRGGYVYVDFWVVAPGSDYKVRVSSDVNSSRRGDAGQREGSSLLELPPVVENETSPSGFSLGEPAGNIDTVARVGFLVNSDGASASTVNTYLNSANYDQRYNKLVGRYQEKGSSPVVNASNTFTIYEPNATRHVTGDLVQGAYYVTKPLGYENNTVAEVDISPERLTVQSASSWRAGSGSTLIDELFQASSGLTASEAHERLIGLVRTQGISLVSTGDFFRTTQTLMTNAGASGYLSPESVSTLLTAGATDDVYIVQLEKNAPQRIRMFIWLEGQDADCVASGASGADFALTLELAGAE